LRDKSNQIIGLVGIGRDITERKKSDMALQESEELYRNLVEKLPDGVYKSTDEGRFVDVNPAMVKMLGYSNKEELLSIDIKTQLYFKASDRENVELQEKLEKIGVYRMKKKDGSEIWVEDHGWLNFDEKSGILFHEGIMRDVTERKRAELALQESEALYRNLVEKLPDGVYKSTHDGKFVDVNPAMVNILGYASKEELMKIDIKTQLYFEPEDRESIVLMEKLEEMGVYRMKKKDGSEIWVEDHGWYNLDENGNINFHEGILRDITERKIAEEEIKSKNEELTKIVAEKDKFFSILAHDLRSPFNSFLGLTHIMAEELPRLTMDEIQKIAVSMKNSATNLFRLLENLLQWSQMQQGLIPYDPKEAPLGPIVDESITMMREPANNKEIEIICNIPATLHVYADSNILQTVIRNLVSNAVKFTQKGGKIQISAKSDVNNTIKIAVQDSGIGISQTMLGNLFKVDIQTNRKGTEGEPSTGLGLLLCKEFIEKHGGRIWAESEEGKGSVFHFTVPETSSSNEKSDQSKDAVDESDKITRLKVLVAEDDNTSGMLISKALKPYSKEILIAKNGLDAIDICHKNPDLDLIMMDIKMPGIDGYETTREIRKFNKDVIIIAQTAFSQINDIEKAKAAGCNDYLIKPLEIPMLVALIQRHFTSKMKKINVVKSQDN
jgi:PAS domain S-box-containing protein